MGRTEPRIAVIICSLGRPELIRSLIPHLMAQTLPANEIILSVPSADDVPSDIDWSAQPVPTRVLQTPKGLCIQRNHALDVALPENDIIVFFDDDFFPSRYALEGIANAFEAFPEIAGLTGRLLADGIQSSGISPAEAARMVAEWDETQSGAVTEPKTFMADGVGLYGCNMAMRSSRIGDKRFDERLPLYGWQEDVDFASRLEGRKIKCDALVGVHCGVKVGRERNGGPLGYSQVANPYYLIRKGSMPLSFGLRLGVRNILSNHARAFRPEPWVDRRGRVKGNWLALIDILRGRSAPERILQLSRKR
ncbi:glycosyltransferase family 2 protein [Limimaricola cinnabarinus]|uniref:glycosyltransferase family 2 protein n=1 Tax=Limimaricola cinnabarinus TaxID=1125964 RepID=UPI0039E56960